MSPIDRHVWLLLRCANAVAHNPSMLKKPKKNKKTEKQKIIRISKIDSPRRSKCTQPIEHSLGHTDVQALSLWNEFFVWHDLEIER